MMTVVNPSWVQAPPGSIQPNGIKIIPANIGKEKMNEIQKRLVIDKRGQLLFI
ncbi:hypothetical protein HMPREF0495_01607 [Levilactobacillus brevis ATCC 14869 = DSM 20054]|uniref:Uncharacterized protein n=1 Tax=Levilactobacillus brevis ATCC 14869 = DSM 20054 TaxID=649758 RepID=U2QPL7_LEVBR|nr:hypothetical protein HMPREF0495_01607 [Levilactobacillus brevis ATCC 14869 = DSM 20054]